MGLNERGYRIIDLPAVTPEVRESFNDLKFDEYMGDNRYRRFAQFRMYRSAENRWEFDRLEHRPYVTFSKYNPVAGGIRRHYDPITADFTPHIRAGAEAVPLETGRAWQVNVHQFRIIAQRRVTSGVIVPEGPHSDGRDYVLIGVFSRHQITGAEMTLMPHGGGEPFYRGTVKEGQGALLADREMFHHVTDIEPTGDYGHRDTLIATWVPWEDKWHGDDFEARALAEG
ncbi:hypothetical protein SAMN04487983_102850 [Streptomyces sp. yr375]|uniref:2OG-Fe dioxygenase family protein n=1 Tax=Streptomyces sp. yr375 TaxID=1761906 RepID=UPI0008C0268F|nr:2OG-Fe dioxygenase family protein [Streptomyces sp. yr375]SES02990.1 hypothetical protein SAMN04487983_102850 [Streptomyces sp. yr375]